MNHQHADLRHQAASVRSGDSGKTAIPEAGGESTAPVTGAAPPHWDGEIDREAWNKLSGRDKGARLRASLERKLAIIEAAASDPSLQDFGGLPMNRAELRRWKDLDRRLWPWSYLKAERADGTHAAALARFDLAAATLRAKSRKQKPVSWEEQLAAKDRIIDALTRQNAALIVQLATRGPALDAVRR